MDPVPSEDMTVYPRSFSGTPEDEVLPRNAAMDGSGDRKLFAYSSLKTLLQQLKMFFIYTFCIFYGYDFFCFDGVCTCLASFSNSFFYA